MTNRAALPRESHLQLTQALAIASGGCFLMIVLRVLLTHNFRYTPLLWNLFLAWIPYLLSLAVRKMYSTSPEPSRRKIVFSAGIGLAWLFFYPNAPYILTDFIHVVRQRIYPFGHPLITEDSLLWYDIILNSAFSFIGHFIGLISLIIMHRIIRRLYGGFYAWTIVLMAIGLGGYGIYLGRFARLNSWDILGSPLYTLRIGLLNLFRIKAVLFSLSCSFFIFLTYLIVYSLFRTAESRKM